MKDGFCSRGFKFGFESYFRVFYIKCMFIEKKIINCREIKKYISLTEIDSLNESHTLCLLIPFLRFGFAYFIIAKSLILILTLFVRRWKNFIVEGPMS